MFLGKARILRIFFISLLSLAAFLGLERLCHLATDGFALSRITHPLDVNEEFSSPVLSREENSDLLKILSQPFYYLNCGGQVYVFASQDGHYVVKFLKFHRRRLPFWIQKLPLPKKLALYRLAKIAKKERPLQKQLRSHLIAYNQLKKETGMIYYHFRKTDDLHKTLTFFDKLGYRYVVNLDDYAFIIQKKGVSTETMINNLMKEGNLQEAQKKLSELLALSVKRYQKGIGDCDFKLESNLGFIDNIASQLDLGSLFLDEKCTHSNFYKAEINHYAKSFRSWLQKSQPLLVEHFDKELEKLP